MSSVLHNTPHKVFFSTPPTEQLSKRFEANSCPVVESEPRVTLALKHTYNK